MTTETLVNEIVTAYGIQPFKVEQIVDQYGEAYVGAALSQVKALPIAPDSPFGWMIAQLRSGRIQAEAAVAVITDEKADWLAQRYCKPQHDATVETAAKRLGVVGRCVVCGKPMVPFRGR